MQFISNYDKKKNKDKEPQSNSGNSKIVGSSSLESIAKEENLKIKIELSSTKDETNDLCF